ncbi:hypothetical protein [Streptomyces sp. SM12]|uniref:hypothetical protein n=1 Tax=Streptomyces sp. SM12 TaxID=1071602 RepID=UPI0015E17DA8|nr:hypothetical protein [Streptomyces sp. SM12]
MISVIYVNRRSGEARAHIEIDRDDLAAVLAGDPAADKHLDRALTDAARRLGLETSK